ncbi:MAG: hypothetical protein ACPGMR_03155 [Pontibacterium sp.]
MKGIMYCIIFLSLLSLTAEAASTKWLWSNSDNKNMFFAATTTEAGRFFGQFCYLDSNTCHYKMRVDLPCTVGQEYPVLVNTDIGARHLAVICFGNTTKGAILDFNNFDMIDELVKSASVIGIAIPVENNRFKVFRFSLIGSAKTIKEMLARANAQKQHNQGSTYPSPDEQYL